MLKAEENIIAVDIAWSLCSYRYRNIPEVDQVAPFLIL